MFLMVSVARLRFQSTPSPRRATSSSPLKYCLTLSFQSTPSPRRATLGENGECIQIFISIHALPAEGDDFIFFPCGGRKGDFNPRPPRGGRPQHHPPNKTSPGYFNPRPPRGGRQQKQLNFNLFFAHFREKFQSIGQKYPALNISIILFWCKNNKIQVRTSQHFLCAFASHQRIRTSSGK